MNIIKKTVDPYFTTKETGIGLYMSKTIIKNNMLEKLSVRDSEEGICLTMMVGSVSQEGRGHEKQIGVF